LDDIITTQDEVILKLKSDVIELNKLLKWKQTSHPPDDIPSPPTMEALCRKGKGKETC